MNYVICGTGRARTGVLAAYLRKLGIGNPDEYYERARFDLFATQEEQRIKAYLESKRVNGILGIKLVWSHVRTIYQSLGLTLPEFVETYVPEPIYLFQTRDPFKQAIESVMYTMRSKGLPFKSEHFDIAEARKRAIRAIVGNHAWRQYFQENAIRPIHIEAEALERDPVAVLESLVLTLGLDIKVPEDLRNTFKDPLMNAFRDKMYSNFMRRYKMLMNDIEVIDYL